MVKTGNKLIGEIENRDLYDSDDDVLNVDRSELIGGVGASSYDSRAYVG